MPARILVIEDNKDNLDLMSYLLSAYGHTALKVTDGEEGLEVAQRELPDLVLCDVQMPKMDGYEVARRIRQGPPLSQLRLVAVTAFAMRGDRDKVMQAGFDGYIAKPIVPEEFVSQVEQFLPADRHSTALPAAQRPEQAQAVPTTYRARLLVVDDSPVNLTLMRSILEPFGYKVTTVHSAREALELARQTPPDLIVSDLHMPDLDGYGLLGIRSKDPILRAIPFLLISSTVWKSDDRTTALALGADRFLLRPVDPRTLLDEVETCLACRKQA